MTWKGKTLVILACIAAYLSIRGCIDWYYAYDDSQYVCHAEIKQRVKAYLKQNPVPPNAELRSACIAEAGSNIGSVWKTVSNGDFSASTLHVALQFPSCAAYIDLVTAQQCVKVLDSRRRACRLYDSPKAKHIGDEIIEWYNDEVHGLHEAHESRFSHILNRLLSKNEFTCYKDEVRILQYPGWEPDAFVVPNGTIVVSEALLALSDSAIAFILGHELAHLEWGSFDAILLKQVKGKAPTILGKLKDAKDLFFSDCRGPLDETFVDQKGIEFAEAAGYDPSAAMDIFIEWSNEYESDERMFCSDDSHPPMRMRARIAAQKAFTVLANREWTHFYYYRGSTWFNLSPLTSYDHPLFLWDGEKPSDEYQAACTRVSTHCGSPEHVPPNVRKLDWEHYACMKRKYSPDQKACVPSDRYAKGHGCPGSELCCPSITFDGFGPETAEHHSTSFCGDPTYYFENKPDDWHTYDCMLKRASPRPHKCLPSSSYTIPGRGNGCPDSELCCPTD